MSIFDKVLVTDKINVSMDYMMPSDWLERWPHMADIELHSIPTDHEQVELVIRLEGSLEDKRFLTTLNNTTQHRDGKYMAKLPFKDSTLPDDMNMAIQRAQSLKRRLDNDEAYNTSYVAQMEKYTNKGYVERVPVSQLDRKNRHVWLMPHHSVRYPFKQKDRVVFDLKARHRRTSLNEHLMQGPDLTNRLTGILLLFREGQPDITADMQEMFHHVKVPVEDRDCLRYLWWPEGDTSKELQIFRMTPHVFSARSSPSVINFCLCKTAQDFGSKYNEEASNSIHRNFYIDNLLKAMDDEEECIEVTRDLINLCGDGGFRLNQWTSSSKRILAAIPEEERDDSVAVLGLIKDKLPTKQSLGIHWNMSIDVFTFRIILKDKSFN
ncbi:uncharacterized protein [Palaemon carinicauda]|uniref:uncharacterized protein n=1 Tax=Palaemon carinicauda TaxID=392227 RepID=UPI0035B664B7